MNKRNLLPLFAALSLAGAATFNAAAAETPARTCTGMACLPDQTKPVDSCKGLDCNPPAPGEATQCDGLDCQPIPEQNPPTPEEKPVTPDLTTTPTPKPDASNPDAPEPGANTEPGAQ